MRHAKGRIDDNQVAGSLSPGAGGNDSLAAIAEIHRALSLDPGNRLAYEVLARAFYIAPTVTGAEIAELDRAIGGDEEGMRLRVWRDALQGRLGWTPAARADLQAAIAAARTPPDARFLAKSLLQVAQFDADQVRIEQLVQAGNVDEARKLIDQWRAGSLSGLYTAKLGELDGWLEKGSYEVDERTALGQAMRGEFDAADATVARGLARTKHPSGKVAYDRLGDRIRMFRAVFHVQDLINEQHWSEARDAAAALLNQPLPSALASQVRSWREVAEHNLFAQ